jgi:hypothetical protein
VGEEAGGESGDVMSGFVQPNKPNVTDYSTFLYNSVGIPVADLPTDSMWIQITLNIAIAEVNLALTCTVAPMYSIACYNLAADRLLNFAIDLPQRSYFTDMRKTLGILTLASGLVSSSSDGGTSQSLETIEAAKKMTLTNLQLAKTPYGRAYMGIAQSYGPTVWGLT